MTSYNMVVQSQLELMMKIAKKRPEIDKSMIIFTGAILTWATIGGNLSQQLHKIL